MRIFQATKTDVPVLVALMDEAYRSKSPGQLEWANESDLFIGNKRTDEDTVSGLMEKPGAGNIEGCVFLQKKNNRLYLGMLSVSPSAQAKGIGKQLLTAADHYAKEQNCSSIYMTVITVRTGLIEWYERHGYKKTGEVIPFPVEEKFGIPKQPLELLILEKPI